LQGAGKDHWKVEIKGRTRGGGLNQGKELGGGKSKYGKRSKGGLGGPCLSNNFRKEYGWTKRGLIQKGIPW